jgi:hypothetical protein
MRIPMPMMLLITLVQACPVWAQSLAPDNRYVLKTRAKYVAGYPYVPRTSKDQPRHARGHFYLGMDALRFRFCSQDQVGAPDPLAEGLTGSVDKSLCEDRCGTQLCQEVRIPYERMKLLARGKVAELGGTSEDIQVGSAGISIAGLIAGVATKGEAQKGLIGAALGAAAVGYGAHVYALKRANYISIFFSPAHQTDSTLPCLSPSSPPAGAPSAGAAAESAGKESRRPADAQPPRTRNLFADASGCNVAVFQIFNSHQYWNISLILNARTGKEFVALGAEQRSGTVSGTLSEEK